MYFRTTRNQNSFFGKEASSALFSVIKHTENGEKPSPIGFFHAVANSDSPHMNDTFIFNTIILIKYRQHSALDSDDTC